MRRSTFSIAAAASVALTVLVAPSSASAAVPTTSAPAAAVRTVAAPVVAPMIKAPGFITTPAAPWRKGQRIAVTFVGFPKNITLLIAVCRSGTNLSRGAQAIGDCAPFAGPSAEFARTNRYGVGKGAVTILRGPLKATNWPGWSCGMVRSKTCVLVVSDLSGKVVVKKPIAYRA